MKTVVVYVSFWKRILTLFFIYVFCVSVSAQVSVNMKEEWYRRSLQNDYVTLPIKTMFEKIQLNKKLTIGVIGGSITAGARASDFYKTAYALSLIHI